MQFVLNEHIKRIAFFIVLNIIYIWRHYHQQLIKQQQISTQSITQNESDKKGSVTIQTNI
jgi:hypothetical protein